MIGVGLAVHDTVMGADATARRALLARIADAGLDHVSVGDHVSFHGGTGFDGLVSATTVLASHDTLPVLVGVYQLALRHPMPTARQLASISEFAPGRLTLGVGVGGEDRSEVSNCGVDPATRGRRMDEALHLLDRLASGAPVDHDGEFFSVRGARVLPAPQPRIPVVVGGAGDVAVRRTAKYGDGWLGMFCSARRFGETRQRVLDAAAEEGRKPDWFGLTVWCGLDADPGVARERLGDQMQRLYHLPYEKFQHITAAGTPGQVADWLSPYVEAGAGSITIVPSAASLEAGVDAAADVRARLNERFA